MTSRHWAQLVMADWVKGEYQEHPMDGGKVETLDRLIDCLEEEREGYLTDFEKECLAREWEIHAAE